MKRNLLTTVSLLLAMQIFAQTDSTKQQADTIKAGNFIIIKKPNKGTDGKEGKSGINISIGKSNGKKKNTNLSTNWWIVDLGFTNFRDETNYANAQVGPYLNSFVSSVGPVTKNSMKLNAGKSSNVNIWVFMQKLNISKKVLNLKYGLGLEMYNFRFDRNISYRKNPEPFVYNDTISFSKNKLYAGYVTVPLMLNIDASPNKKRGFSFSGGVSAGYLIASRNKQVSDARGKVKYKGDFDLQPFRLAAIGEIGLGPVRIYGSYSLNALHNSTTRLEQYPYAVGIRLSNW
jgi:hypothetical protein